MMRLLTLIITLFITTATTLSGEYQRIASLAEIQHELDALTPDDIAVFDVDLTLIIPKDKIVRPCGFGLLRILKSELLLTNEQVEEYGSAAMTQLKTGLFEPIALTMVHRLQQRQVPVIALTAIRTGAFGCIPSVEGWRFNQLLDLNFDFRKAFAGNPGGILLTNSAGKATSTFYNGIIASGDEPKGEALAALFENLHWRPNLVIFVDDCLDFIESVEDSMQCLGIPCKSFHYVAYEYLNETLDEEVAHFQIDHFYNTKIWLSDEQAQELLRKAS